MCLLYLVLKKSVGEVVVSVGILAMLTLRKFVDESEVLIPKGTHPLLLLRLDTILSYLIQ